MEGIATIISLAGMGIGIYFFFAGLKNLHIRRLIQKTPTSKISTGAVGSNVEVVGRVVSEKENIVQAPISGRPCAFYSIEIQRWDRKRKSGEIPFGSVEVVNSSGSGTTHDGSWETVDCFFSGKGFFIDDKSGANALVLTEGAVINRKGGTRDYEIRSRNFDKIPDGLRQALETNSKKLKNFKFKTISESSPIKFRFREWMFSVGESIYVLGYADSGVTAFKNKTMKIKAFLKAKKTILESDELRNQFDTNQDGELDDKELRQGAKIIAQQLESQYSKEKLKDLISRTKIIFKQSQPNPFYISNMSEKELVDSQQSTWSTCKIWGGPVLSTGCAAYLFTVFFA